MSNFLHYDFIAEFKRQYYKDLLLAEHLQGSQIKIDKLSYPNGSSDERANFWGYVLVKNGKKYLLPAKDANNKEIDIRTIFPILVETEQKVAYAGDAYWWIRSWRTARLKPEQHLTFKEMVDQLSSLGHTHKSHQRLFTLMGLASMMGRVNFRVCSPPGFGKDSVVDVLGNLIGGAGTLENPTLAKLEWETQKKWLVMNEAVGVTPEKWREIEQFLLAAGAHKPEIAKHSRAGGTGLKETLDISQFSLSIAYNDIDNYPDVDKYFDSVTKKAIQDRFPPFRLYGTLSHDFNEAIKQDPVKFVKDNMAEYKKLVQSYAYYVKNSDKELHRYKQVVALPRMPDRWVTNTGRILRMLDMYAQTQAEYDELCKLLFACMEDYKAMLQYPSLYKATYDTIGDVAMSALLDKLNVFKTFAEKNNALLQATNRETVRAEAALDQFLDVI